MSTANSAQYERSALYYSADADLILQAGDADIRYGVLGDAICRESPVLRQKLEAARLADQSVGRSDQNPLPLEVEKDDLEALLGFRSGKVEIYDDFLKLTRALQLATYYLMVPTRRQVIFAMSVHRNFCSDPPVLLRIGQLSGVKRWFHDGYKTILTMPLSALSSEDCKTIGGELIYCLIQSKTHMDMLHRLQVVAGPTFRKTSGCSGKTCQLGWRGFWDRNVVPMVLVSDNISSARIRAQLHRTPVGMCVPCYRHNIISLCDSGELDLTEDMACKEATDAWALIAQDKRGAGLGEEEEAEDNDDSYHAGVTDDEAPEDSNTEDGDSDTEDGEI